MFIDDYTEASSVFLIKDRSLAIEIVCQFVKDIAINILPNPKSFGEQYPWIYPSGSTKIVLIEVSFTKWHAHALYDKNSIIEWKYCNIALHSALLAH